jgi:hypothetical protein
MKSLCFLIATFVISISLFADTLVLKNGKKLEGTIVEEDAETYRIRDSQGIVILVKKSQVDSKSISETNIKKTEEPAETKAETKPAQTPTSVADVARNVRDSKKKNVRVLTNEDLDEMPEVSIIGTEETGEEEEAPEPEVVEERRGRTEEDWKEETRKFAADLRRAREDVEVLSKDCDDLGRQAAYAMVDPLQYVNINGVWVPIAGSYDASVIQQSQEVCRQAEEAKKDLARIQEELERFQDYARREGALPGWVDPDRL